MSFLTRTRSLDQHVSIRLNLRADQISDRVKRESERHGENYKDLDGPPMRCLANMFVNHAYTEVITAWLENQDTAFRDQVPRMVFEILKDNTFE